MQSIFIDKKTMLVTAGMICPTGEKANPEDYPNDIIVYRAEGTYLDLNKAYKYVDGEFIAYTPKVDGPELNPQEILTKQITSLMIENKKKDKSIEGLAKMVSELSIQIQKRERGGNV